MSLLLPPFSRDALRGDPNSLDIVFEKDSMLFWVGSCSLNCDDVSAFWKAFQKADVEELGSSQDIGAGCLFVIVGPSANDPLKWALLAIQGADGLDSEDELMAVVETAPLKVQPWRVDHVNVDQMLKDDGIGGNGFFWKHYFVGVKRLIVNLFR